MLCDEYRSHACVTWWQLVSQWIDSAVIKLAEIEVEDSFEMGEKFALFVAFESKLECHSFCQVLPGREPARFENHTGLV